jgi:hypothetical protein
VHLTLTQSRIHERTISLRFLGIILRVLRLEVSIYNVYIINQVQSPFAREGGGPLVEVTVNSKEENSKVFCPNYFREFGLWCHPGFTYVCKRNINLSLRFLSSPSGSARPIADFYDKDRETEEKLPQSQVCKKCWPDLEIRHFCSQSHGELLFDQIRRGFRKIYWGISRISLLWNHEKF